jgi:hypothetical protein
VFIFVINKAERNGGSAEEIRHVYSGRVAKKGLT